MRRGQIGDWVRLSLLFAAGGLTAWGQQPLSFADKLYPVLQKAGCRMCHNPEGVASPTRLRFPEEDAPRDRVEAFGKSLVELVDRRNPGNSVLLQKPTNRIKHSGGERIRKSSAEEALLREWIGYLAALSGVPRSARRQRFAAEAGARPV